MLDYQHFLNIALLLWGCLFCLIAAVCLFFSKNYSPRRRTWMLHMQLSTAFLLGGDAIAWMFRGYPGTVGFYMVRIGNFIVFAGIDLVLLFFHEYVCSYLMTPAQRKKSIRANLAFSLGILGILLVIVSQFTDLYYYFDADNFYHRAPAYILSMLIPATGMVLDLSLLLQYRRRMSNKMFFTMCIYFVLPFFATTVQLAHYGFSLINLSIAFSMMIMYVIATREQNATMGNLARSKREISEKLEIASTLNKCITMLSSDEDMDTAIENLLGIINEYFKADRTYIFETNFDKNTMDNTYEYAKAQVDTQKENLQDIPLSILTDWMESFQRTNVFYIPDLEQQKGIPTYELLKSQNISRLLAVPIWKQKTIVGFLGVDNPSKHYDDPTLLGSIQFFICNSLERKKEQDYLKYLSYRDMLTGTYNRNRYSELLESQEVRSLARVGVAYIDLNGLKHINDTQGHKAGDELIRKAAQIITSFFGDDCYRIGGDEFVIIRQNAEQEEFTQKMTLLQKEMVAENVSVSIGFLWQDRTDTQNPERLEALLKKADSKMYEEKRKYYEKGQLEF